MLKSDAIIVKGCNVTCNINPRNIVDLSQQNLQAQISEDAPYIQNLSLLKAATCNVISTSKKHHSIMCPIEEAT